ncbi:MAG: NAD-dependent epimerase/dehydratase family protein [Verrucomicrobiales bacterium]
MTGTAIIAGCGYVGAPLAASFARSGVPVVGLARSASGEAVPFPLWAADLTDPASLGEVRLRLDGGGFPRPWRAVHCASSGRGGAEAYRAVYVEGSQNLLAALEPDRFVFTSSTSVYPQAGGEDVDESSPAEPDRETGRLLREAERIALAAGGNAVRLAGIYGPGRSFLLLRFLQGAAAIDGDPGDAEAPGRLVNQIHRDDAAAALRAVLENADPGQIFNAADSMPMVQREIYAELSARFALPMPPVKAPDAARKRGWTNKRVLAEKLRALGWQPQFPSFFTALDDAEFVASIRALADG